jgi:5-methylcytosine-specific restriction protein B
MKFKDFDTNKNAFHSTIKIIVEWLGFMSTRWFEINEKNKFIEQNLQPLLTGTFRDPQVNSGELHWPSPALGTFLRYLGLINDSYEVSPLCELMINNQITLEEYSIIILSKQRGFINDKPKINFLALLCLYIQKNSYKEITIENISFLSQVEGYNLKIDPQNKDKNRDDILFNSVKMTGLFIEERSKLILKENAKSIVDFIAENHLMIGVDERIDKHQKYSYYGDIESGIFNLKDLKLPVEWHDLYPNIFNKKNVSTTINSLFSFSRYTKKAGLLFPELLIQRFIASLCTKPFVICSGLSGSGKTKLAQSFAQWICENENQYKIIAVGADWTNREPLLGYPNGLDPKSYVSPDSGALKLILEASKDENKSKPYFLILDEMNLSHVERYFSDFLSIMESKEKLKLYSGEKRYTQLTKENEFDEEYFIPFEIEWPKNLFIVGTVNIDETTYMFSPKVLDRANVIEFRITPIEMNNFFIEGKELKMEELFLDKDKSKGGAGQFMAENFLQLAEEKKIIKIPEIEGEMNVLNKFFGELQNVGSEFGYRSASEIEQLITKLGIKGFVDDKGQPLKNNTKIDIAIMQKLLPKLHGSRKKLVNPLEVLAGFCIKRINDSIPDSQNEKKNLYQQYLAENKESTKWEIMYPISLEKIERMYQNVIDNGFTSYAEA